MKIGSITKLSKKRPRITVIATSISVIIPEGINAANVPRRIIAADIIRWSSVFIPGMVHREI